MAYEHRLRILVVLMDGDATPTMLAANLAIGRYVDRPPPAAPAGGPAGPPPRAGRQVFYGIDGEVARLVTRVLSYVRRPRMPRPLPPPARP